MLPIQPVEAQTGATAALPPPQPTADRARKPTGAQRASPSDARRSLLEVSRAARQARVREKAEQAAAAAGAAARQRRGSPPPTVDNGAAEAAGRGTPRVEQTGEAEAGSAASAGSLVQAKILETMKRGINEARTRTDLAPGDKKMLEHMKMYVMETKMAEMNLSEEERLIWEELKAEYVASNARDKAP